MAALAGSCMRGPSAKVVTGQRDVTPGWPMIYGRGLAEAELSQRPRPDYSSTRLHSYTIGLKFVTSRSTAYSDPDYSST